MKFKLASVAILVMGMSFVSKAQEWKKLMSEGAPYSEIVSTFEKEWGDKPYERHQGFKPFYRYKNFWKTRLNSDGEISSKMNINQAQAEYMAALPPLVNGNEDDGYWRTEGPFNHVNTASWSSGQGRVNVIVEDPTNPDIIFVGAPDGGLWKSTDAGSTWSSLIDHFSRLGISDIAIDPTNSDIIYLATGDADGGDAPSIGIWKTIDGGTTWNESGSITSNRIYKISIDPDNNSRIIAATSTGIIRSVNGGTTWTSVYSEGVNDIQFAIGSGSQIAYGVTGSEFIKSVDDGATWVTITNGILTDFQYMEFALTADDSNYVYVVTTGGGTADDSEYSGIYKSTDLGTTFTQVHTLADADIFDGSGQAWYDLDIAVDQNDKDVIVVGLLNICKSTNGGSDWNAINNWSTTDGPSYTHADIHYLQWYGGNLYCGSDGGIYKSTDNGLNFTDLTEGLPIGQYYDLDVYQNDPSYMSGGLQDNGGYYFDGIWKCYYGADGMVNLINHKDSTDVYGMIQNGGLYHSNNGGLQSGGLGKPVGEDGEWVTPMEWDSENERVIAGYKKMYSYTNANGWQEFSTFSFTENLVEIELYNDKTNTILASTPNDGIYYTSNAGVTWTNVSANLPFPNNYIKDIEFDESDSSHFFVVQTNNIYETTNAGTTWTEISGSLPSTNYNDIEMDPSETNKSLYLATDVAVHYFNTTLGDWIPFNDNLPNVVVSDIELLPNFDAIRISTFGRGIYASHLYEKEIHRHDAQILNQSTAIDTFCSPGVSSLNIEFKNRAWDTINNISYEVLVDGVSELTSMWTGNLLPFQTTSFTTGTVDFTAGDHDITYILSNPNGVTDSAPKNDTLRTNLFVESGADLNTLVVEIQFDGNPTKNSWELSDDAGVLVESSGGTYPFSLANETITRRLCVEDGCYVFKMLDNNSDFSGTYKLFNQSGAIIYQYSGNFGASNENDFCLPTPVASPVADFAVSDSTVCFESEVQFSDSSVNTPSSWAWTFDGGSPMTSTLQNPIIAYNSSGSFNVQLIVENNFGIDTLIKENYIEVFEEVEYTFSQSTDPSLSCQDSVINRITTTLGYEVEWKDMTGTVLSSTDSLVVYTGGDYSYTVTNPITNCEVTDTFDVSFGELTLDFNITHSQCLGFDNGIIETTVIGGIAPYTVVWSDPSMTNLLETNVQAGDYEITVTDVNGCESTESVTVENQLVFNLNINVINHTTCLGGADGIVTANISGGQPPYSYEWSMDPLNDIDTIGNISAGTHSVKITDNNGCYVEQEFTVNDGYQPTINYNTQDEVCESGYDGGIVVSVSGGVPPFTYSWSGGLPDSPVINGLTAGNYSLTVTDINGCSASELITVNTTNVFVADYTVVKERCDDEFNGSIEANITGGQMPYTYEWLNVPGVSNTSFVENLTTGDYYLSITGANGCQRTDTIHVGITSPIVASFTVDLPFEYLDDDPTFQFQNTSVGGSAYSWNFGDGAFSNLNSPEHTYTSVGEFHVKLIVFNGYCSKEFTMEVNVYPNVGIEDFTNSNFEILPNPNNGSFSITLNSAINKPSIKIFDITGREIISKSIDLNESKLTFESLTRGSYIVKLFSDNEFIQLEKMVVN